MVAIVQSALRSLRGHALRLALTSLGIAWGTAMLTVFMAYTHGYDLHFQRQIAKVGPRVVWAFPGAKLKARLGQRGTQLVKFKNIDAKRLESLHSVQSAAPNLWLGLRIHRRGDTTKLLWTYGVTAATASIRNIEVARGRFVSPLDVERSARVVFLGSEAARRLFGPRPAVGRIVHVDGVPFRVIGVARPKGDQIVNLGPRDDELSLIPVTTAQRLFTHNNGAGVLIFAPRSRAQSAAARREVRAILGLHHHFRADDDRAVSFFDIQEAVKLINRVGLGLSLFLTSSGILTLVVGAVGVMNIMLVVVGERTREIGLRKAVGASNAAVFTQFLLEAVAVTGAAGAAGTILGVLAVRGIAALLPSNAAFTPVPELDLSTIAGIAVILVIVGVTSGMLPARRAARTDPAVSLRSV